MQTRINHHKHPYVWIFFNYTHTCTYKWNRSFKCAYLNNDKNTAQGCLYNYSHICCLLQPCTLYNFLQLNNICMYRQPQRTRETHKHMHTHSTIFALSLPKGSQYFGSQSVLTPPQVTREQHARVRGQL